MSNIEEDVNLEEIDFSISQDRLLKLTTIDPVYALSLKDKPNSFGAFAEWAKHKITSLKNSCQNPIVIFNNSIVIDNILMLFAEFNKINVKCLAFDSLLLGSDQSSEAFMMLGVFEINITINEKQFQLWVVSLPCPDADEGFIKFVVINADEYNEYELFLNNYLAWQNYINDNETKKVNVIGGADYIYAQDKKWTDFVCPREIKDEIKGIVDRFVMSKDKFLKKNIPWRRSLLLWGPSGNGKTTLINTILSEYDITPVTVTLAVDENQLAEAFNFAERNVPSLLFFENLDMLIKNNYVSAASFENQFNRINSSNGILVLATVSNLSKLPDSLINYPSRFDRKFEIPMPDADLSLKYLKKCFKGCRVNSQLLNQIVEISIENDFTYAHLRELYLSSILSAISKKRQMPTVEDINDAVNTILKEKKSVEERFVTKSKKKLGFSKER